MIDLSSIKTIGSGIARPEGVMALDDGTIVTADENGRCAKITPNGQTTFWGALGGTPNGICFDAEGNCIVANIGNGQVQSLTPGGSHEVLLTEVDGRRISAPNFPYVDSKVRLWVSDSTQIDRFERLQKPIPDGCVVMIENGKARIAADGLYFANGLTLDRREEYLYVAETTRMDVLRFKVRPDGSLGPKEVFGPSPLIGQDIPDGIAFDEAGNLWVTFPNRNAIGYITPQGDLNMVIEDPEYRVLQRPSNICFGGKERRTAYIGSLSGTSIPYFEVPHPGMRLVHQKK
jgi:gluconolactonase